MLQDITVYVRKIGKVILIYDKWDDFDFDIVNFEFLDSDVPRAPSYGIYISQLRVFGLLEYLIIWLTSILVTKLLLLNFSNKGVGIKKRFF